MSTYGATVTILVTQLAEAVAKDEAPGEGGFDLSAGMLGQHVSEWIRETARELEARSAETKRLLVLNYELLGLLARCQPIIESDALMMADISRHAPLDFASQAEHDSTEYESERLVRELESLLGPRGQKSMTIEVVEAAGRNLYFEGQHSAEEPEDTSARLALVLERDALRAALDAAVTTERQAIETRIRAIPYPHEGLTRGAVLRAVYGKEPKACL